MPWRVWRASPIKSPAHILWTAASTTASWRPGRDVPVLSFQRGTMKWRPPGLTTTPSRWSERAASGRHHAGTLSPVEETASLPPGVPSAKHNTHREATKVAKNTKQTGPKAASNASKVLSNPKSTKAEKSAAASALSQTPKRK